MFGGALKTCLKPINKQKGAPWDVVLALQSSENTANTMVLCMGWCWRLGETRVFACARHLVPTPGLLINM